jgi:phage shock protein E
MKNTSYVALGMLVLMILVTPACDWLKNRVVASHEQPVVRILDVNTAEVYHDAHIPGSVHLELDDIEKVAEHWNKKTSLILYCSDHTCRTSHIAAKKLKTLGFEDVSVYPGGIHEWFHLSKENSELYPLEGDAKLPFLQKDVEKGLLKEEDGKVISAQEVAQRLGEKSK